MWIIRKNTYPIKEKLKSDKCKWNSQYKCWIFPTESIAKKYANSECIKSLSELTLIADLKPPKDYRHIGKRFYKVCIINILHVFGRQYCINVIDINTKKYYAFYITDKLYGRFGEGQILEITAKLEKGSNIHLIQVHIEKE